MRRMGELSFTLSWIKSIKSIPKHSSSLLGRCIEDINLNSLFPKEMYIAPILQLMHGLAVAKNGQPRMMGILVRLCVDSISRTMKLTRK